jgi:hypothetical protein
MIVPNRLMIAAIGGTIVYGVLVVGFPDEAAATLVVIVLSGLALGIFRNFADDKEFVTKVFLAACGSSRFRDIRLRFRPAGFFWRRREHLRFCWKSAYGDMFRQTGSQ